MFRSLGLPLGFVVITKNDCFCLMIYRSAACLAWKEKSAWSQNYSAETTSLNRKEISSGRTCTATCTFHAQNWCGVRKAPKHLVHPKKRKTLSLCFTCEIEFLTFNFMDEIKNSNTNQFPAVQLQGNGLCPRRLKPAFRGKDKTWTESGTNMLIYMHILSVGNLRKYRGHFISRILFNYE